MRHAALRTVFAWVGLAGVLVLLGGCGGSKEAALESSDSGAPRTDVGAKPAAGAVVKTDQEVYISRAGNFRFRLHGKPKHTRKQVNTAAGRAMLETATY